MEHYRNNINLFATTNKLPELMGKKYRLKYQAEISFHVSFNRIYSLTAYYQLIKKSKNILITSLESSQWLNSL